MGGSITTDRPSEVPPAPAPPPIAPRPRRWWLIAGAGSGLGVALLIGGVYLARERIMVASVTGWLKDHGVAASVTAQGLTSTGVVVGARLGAAADPDLVVDRIEVHYALLGPWTGDGLGLRVKSVRLVRPRLRLRWTDRGLDFGSLDRLVRDLERQPASGPIPDIEIVDGRLRLITPGGDLTVTGDGAERGGALDTFSARVEPFGLSSALGRLSGGGGRFDLSRRDGRLILHARLDQSRAQTGTLGLTVGAIRLAGSAPYPPANQPLIGDIEARVDASDITAASGPNRATGATLTARLAGRAVQSPGGFGFAGALKASAGAAGLDGGALKGRGAAATIDLPSIKAGWTPGASSARLTSGSGSARLDLAGLDAAAGRLANLVVTARAAGLRLETTGGRLRWAADLDGALNGQGSVAAAALGPGAPPALRDALAKVRVAAPAWRGRLTETGGSWSLPAPLEVVSANGARLSATGQGTLNALAPASAGTVRVSLAGPGLPTLDLQASGAGGPAAFAVDLAAKGAMADAGPAKEVRVAFKGRATRSGGTGRFDLVDCAAVSAGRMVVGGNALAGASGRLCPGAGPLLTFGPAGWRASGRLDQVRSDFTDAQVRLTEVAAGLEAQGRGGTLDRGVVTLTRARLDDLAKPERFLGLEGAGRFEFAQGAWRGTAQLADSRRQPLGTLAISPDGPPGAGRIDADLGVTFSKSLQPSGLATALDFARDATGAAAFKGWVSWSGSGVASSGGLLTLKSVGFSSPSGPVRDVNAAIRLTSLLPPTTAPGQTLSVGEVQAVTPITKLFAAFDVDSQSITLRELRGAMADGAFRLDPSQILFRPGATVSGVLRVDRINLGKIIAASSLAGAVKTDAVVSGQIPFTVSDSGLTIAGGALAAVAPGRISISRAALTGPPTAGGAAAAAQPDFASSLAYDAMEDLAFDELKATVNSQAGDRLGVLFHIRGRHDPPHKTRAVIALSDLAAGRAFAKPLALPSDTKIDLTLDTSVNFGDVLKSLATAWRDAIKRRGGQDQATGKR